MPGEVCKKLGRISGAAIDRLLRNEKQKYRIKGTSGTKPHIKSFVPVMSHFECKEYRVGLGK